MAVRYHSSGSTSALLTNFQFSSREDFPLRGVGKSVAESCARAHNLSGSALCAGTDALKEVAEPLRPRQRRSRGDGGELGGVKPLCEFREDRGHVIKPACPMLVAHQIQRGC